MYVINSNGYNPIGNVLNMGSGYNQPNMNIGYNQIQPQMINNNPLGQMSGYYNGMYNNMYNPYLLRQQMQRQQALEQERKRKELDTWKMMSTAANNYTGVYNEQQMQERLKMYDPKAYEEDEELKEYMKTNRLMQINQSNQNGQSSYQHQILQNQINYINDMVSKSQEQFGEMSLAEFMNTAMGDLLYEAKMQEYKRRQRQLGGMYNSQQYNQLINQSQPGSSYFNSIYDNNKPFQSNIDISDMEISLPNSIQSEMEARKARFLNALK